MVGLLLIDAEMKTVLKDQDYDGVLLGMSNADLLEMEGRLEVWILMIRARIAIEKLPPILWEPVNWRN